MEIIPAIDIIEGKCVRLRQGNFELTTVYTDDPVAQAKEFEALGAKRLHLVDLDGARNRQVTNWQVLELIAKHTSLQIDFGGGVNTLEHCKKILELGARYVTVGSLAARKPDLVLEWMMKIGPEKFFIGIDLKDGQVAIAGWKEFLPVSVHDLLDTYMNAGFNYFFSTDIARDGMLSGPSYPMLYRLILKHKGINLVASGGISSVEDLQNLQKIGCKGAIIGKAFYEKKLAGNPFLMF